MQQPRLNEVLTRVVAWHNRHPLARRIQAAQVHSLGEVLLPFASTRALVDNTASTTVPAAATRIGASLADVVSARAAARPMATPAAPAVPELEPPPRSADRPAEVAAPDSLGWLHRLCGHLNGRRPGWPALEAAFSRDFIWPLTPRQVARWAQGHGQPHTLAPADWPRRRVAPDPARLAVLQQAGLLHTVQLHLLTAAIGVGDRRIRLLIDGDGQIIGPRAYSRPRVASVGGLLVLLLAGAGWTWGGAGAGGDTGQAALPATAASAVSAISAVAAVSVATAAASAAPTTATATATAAAAVSAPAEPASADTLDVLPAPPLAPQTETRATADAAPLGRIRPSLSDDDKRLARQQAAQLRAPAAADSGAAGSGTTMAPVYAVVTRPTRQRETAAGGLAVMRATGAQLAAPVPEHGELMQNQAGWRAAWWPFANQVDAERARVMLAARGLKAEVVEF